MSAFTNAVGSSFMGTMGAVLGSMAMAQAEAEARSAEDWKAWAQYYKKAHAELAALANGIKGNFDDLAALYNALEEKHKSLLAEADDLREQLAKKDRQLAAKDRELAAKNSELAAKDEELSRKHYLYREADQRAGDMARRAIQAHKRIEELEAKLKAQEGALQPHLAQIEKLKGQLEHVRKWHAANLALRSALEVQLLRADPDNPLLQDAMLRDRVRRSGEMALATAPDDGSVDPYDAAREAGVSFSVPGRPSGVEVLQELALTEAYMKRLLQLNLPQDHALRLLQTLQRGYGTMTAARELLQQMEPGSELLSTQATQRARQIAMEEFQRLQQQRRQQAQAAPLEALVQGQQRARERVAQELLESGEDRG